MLRASLGSVGIRRRRNSSSILFRSSCCRFELLPGEGLQLRVALAEHLFRFLDAGEGMTIAMVAFHQWAKLGVFASEPAKTHLVICHAGFGEQAGELFESIA